MLRFFRPYSEIVVHTPIFPPMLRNCRPYSDLPVHTPKLSPILRFSGPCSEIVVQTPIFRSMLRNCRPYSDFPVHTPKLAPILRFFHPYSEIGTHTPIFPSSQLNPKQIHIKSWTQSHAPLPLSEERAQASLCAALSIPPHSDQTKAVPESGLSGTAFICPHSVAYFVLIFPVHCRKPPFSMKSCVQPRFFRNSAALPLREPFWSYR